MNLQKLQSLKGRTVLVTGAAGKLGEVITDTLAELGASLILVDRVYDDLERLSNQVRSKWGVNSLSISCDLENQESRLALIDSVKTSSKQLNCLINNAAFVGGANLEGWNTIFEMQTLETWRRAIEVNLTATFHLSQGFASLLAESQGANIINLSSIYGHSGPDWRLYEGTQMGNPVAYSVSKGGVIQLTRWLATTLAPRIRVNSISPGGIFRDQPEIFVNRYEDRTPMGRMAIEDDFRGAIAFLATDMSSYVTGQILNVDGGWSVW